MADAEGDFEKVCVAGLAPSFDASRDVEGDFEKVCVIGLWAVLWSRREISERFVLWDVSFMSWHGEDPFEIYPLQKGFSENASGMGLRKYLNSGQLSLPKQKLGNTVLIFEALLF